MEGWKVVGRNGKEEGAWEGLGGRGSRPPKMVEA